LVSILDFNSYDNDEAEIIIEFSNTAKLRAEYWRIIVEGHHRLSSFDHLQLYGLPARIDARQELRNILAAQSIMEARWDRETGDLIFDFTGNIKLQVLNFTGYEIWEITFPNGTGELSNFAREL
jgi:hypothetical protein